MLAEGGSAVDAILATAITLTLVEPVSNGIGSDAFAHRVGRQAAARPQRLGPLAGSLDAGVLSRRPVPGARLEHRHAFPAASRPGPRCTPAGAGCRSRSSSSARSATGARVSSSRPPSPANGRSRCRSSRTSLASRRRSCPTVEPPAAGQRFKFPEHAADAGDDRSHGRQGVLSGRARREDGGPLRRERRRDDATADMAAHKPDWVEAARDGLPRLHAARDPAQRPGDRRADRARHAGALRPALACRSTPPTACTCRSRRSSSRFADARRYVADLDHMMDVKPAQLLDRDVPQAAAKLIDPKRAQEFGRRHAAERRHRLSHGGRRLRHDGFVHPVQLHGIRLGRRGSRHGMSLQNRGATFVLSPAIRTRSARESAPTTPSSRRSSPRTANR